MPARGAGAKRPSLALRVGIFGVQVASRGTQMKIPAGTTLVTLFLALPATAFALGEERFGNAPAVKQPDWASGVLDVVNLDSRVYSQWVNGNENFFYRGNARALNEALRKYAAVKDDVRRLIL